MRKRWWLAGAIVLACCPLARAEWGAVVMLTERRESVIDAQRLRAEEPNQYDVTIGGRYEGLVFVEVRPNVAIMSVHVALFDGERRTVSELSGDEDGSAVRFERPIAPGRYTLEIDDAHRHKLDNPYRLTIRFVPVADRYEPNDVATGAKRLRDGVPAQITLFGFRRRDEDWFAFEHPGGQLEIETSAVPRLTPHVTVRNEENEEVGLGVAPAAGEGLHYTVDLPAGRYFLVFRDAAGINVPTPVTVKAAAL